MTEHTASATDRPQVAQPSRPFRKGIVSGRTREGRYVAAYQVDLVRHVGGTSKGALSVVLQRIIERCGMLALHLLLFDEKALAEGGLTPRDSREYLALHGSLVRTLAQLDGVAGKAGAKAKAEQKPEGLAGMAARHYAQSNYSPSVPVVPDAPEGDER